MNKRESIYFITKFNISKCPPVANGCLAGCLAPAYDDGWHKKKHQTKKTPLKQNTLQNVKFITFEFFFFYLFIFMREIERKNLWNKNKR